jgi:hypothetical protein
MPKGTTSRAMVSSDPKLVSDQMAAQILEIMDSSGATALLIFVSY